MLARKVVAYVAGFGLARGALFFAPIVLANLVSVELYGTVELAQSVAVIGALLLGCGLPASVPLVLLRHEVKARWDTLLGIVAVLALALLIAAVAIGMATGSGTSLAVLIPLGMAVLLLQGLWATTLKTRGQSTKAVFLEAGFWVAAAIGGGIITLVAAPAVMLSLALAGYGLFLWIFTAGSYIETRRAFKLCDIRDNLSVGAPLMFTALLAVLVSSAGRLVLGYSSSIETVGLYAILYRATALPLVGHQLLIIGMFRQIFSLDNKVLQQRVLVIPLGVTGFALLFWLLADHIGILLGERFVQVYGEYRLEALIILTQTVLWSAIALNDLLNARLLIAGQVARYSLFYLILALPILVLITIRAESGGELASTLYTFVIGHSALMLGYYLTQCVAIFCLGHRFTKLWICVLSCYAVLLFVIFVIPSP